MFSLAMEEITVHCNRQIIRTEDPKLLIFQKSNDAILSLLYASDIVADKDIVNFDLAAYTNSKFVYVERHIRTQMNILYVKIMWQKFKIER